MKEKNISHFTGRIKSFIQYYSGSHAYTEYSFLKLSIWKLGVIRRLFGEIRKNKKIIFVDLNQINKKFKIPNPKPALVCATGLSLNEIDINFINAFKEFGDIFSINDFPFTNLGLQTKIDYQSVLDNEYHSLFDNGQDSYKPGSQYKLKFRNWLSNDFTGILICSFGQMSEYEGEKIFLKTLTAPTFTKSIDPMKIVGFQPYTTLFTISTAIWLGYDPIYVVGLDSSHHSFISVTDSGTVLRNHHAYNRSLENKHWHGRPDAVSILSSNALVIEKMKLFAKHNVNIIGKISHIDSLPRISPFEILAKHGADFKS